MVTVYSIYLIVSVAFTYFVGRSLNKNGRLFLVKIFKDNEAIADSINHLLLVGFYLVNLGFISLALKYGAKPYDAVTAVEFLSTKVGLAIVVLGVMHFFNMRCLLRFRQYNYFASFNAEPKATEHAAA